MSLNVFRRIREYEYWPFYLFYVPVYFYWCWLSLKARSFLFFSAANPRMFMGGFAGTSKYQVLSDIAPEYRPKTMLVNRENPDEIVQSMSVNEIEFPVIVKPDRGERGYKVHKIYNYNSLLEYRKNSSDAFLIQEFIAYPVELGIMYVRLPGENKGMVTSVVGKEFASVTGNGKRTLRELISADERFSHYLHHFETLWKKEFEKILPEGKTMLLEEIGNHCRGTAFKNRQSLINEKLEYRINEIASTIPDFYFGRFDLRCLSYEGFLAGFDFKILELNGANSEPAHIYDSDYKLIQAYRDMFQHWNLLYQVSKRNHRNGIPYMKFWKGLRYILHHWKKTRKP